MDFLQVLVLALVQGITEFLPISSSAHLILVPVLTPWTDQGLAFDVALHFGSLSAVLWYFRKDLQRLLQAFWRQPGGGNADSRLLWFIVLGTIPTGLVGIIFSHWIDANLRGALVIATTTIAFGLLLWFADRRRGNRRDEYSLNWRDVLIIGLAQAMALIPGTSRSGITITAALLLGLKREAAARFSFLLSIPVIILATALSLLKLSQQSLPVDWPALLLGTVLSALSAYACIHLFLRFIERIGMLPFVIYRLFLGVLLLLLWL